MFGEKYIEPVEVFLSQVICPTRLAMYSEAIDALKFLGRYSSVEAVNSIVDNSYNESPGDIESLVNNSLRNHLVDALGLHDIVVIDGTLPWLTKLANIVHVLDEIDISEAIVNVISTTETNPTRTLYDIINLFDYVDEDKYFSTVKMVSISFLERLLEIHSSKMKDTETNDNEAVTLDMSVARKILGTHRELLAARLVESGEISYHYPAKGITSLIRDRLEPVGMMPRQIAAEYIGMYLLTGLSGDNLKQLILDEVNNTTNDPKLATIVTTNLDAVYLELTT